MTLNEELFKAVKEKYKVVNDNLIIKNNKDDLVNLLIWIVDGISHVSVKKDSKGQPKLDKNGEKIMINNSLHYLYHDERIPTQKEKSEDTLPEYYVKSNDKEQYYVEIDSTEAVVVDIYCMFSVDIYQKVYHENLLFNTKNKLISLIEEGKIKTVTKEMQKIIDGNYSPIYKETPELNVNYNDDLIYKIKMYIPINQHGYYILNGNKYYHGYFMKSSMTSKGKLVCEHNALTSYLKINKEEVVHEVYASDYNPFIFSDDIISQEYIDEMKKKVSEDDAEIIQNTYNSYLNILENPENYKTPMVKAMTSIDFEYLMDMVIVLLNADEEDSVDEPIRFHKYYTLLAHEKKHNKTGEKRSYSNKSGGNINSDIRKYIPKNTKNKPEGTRKRWNPHSMGMITAFKIGKTTCMHNTSNPIDIHFTLHYIKTVGEFLPPNERKYKIEDMGILDPISASGKNVGASGSLVPSLSDDYIIQYVGKRQNKTNQEE